MNDRDSIQTRCLRFCSSFFFWKKNIFDLTMHLKVDLSSVTHPGSPSLTFCVLRLIKTLQALYPQSKEGWK